VKPCTFWPSAPAEGPVRIGPGNRAPGILMVQSTGDIATPYPGAVHLHRLLRNSRMVTLAGAYVHALFLVYGNACVDTAVTSYLVTGALPVADVTCTAAAVTATPAPTPLGRISSTFPQLQLRQPLSQPAG
jgi:hypothetical protein